MLLPRLAASVPGRGEGRGPLAKKPLLRDTAMAGALERGHRRRERGVLGRGLSGRSCRGGRGSLDGGVVVGAARMAERGSGDKDTVRRSRGLRPPRPGSVGAARVARQSSEPIALSIALLPSGRRVAAGRATACLEDDGGAYACTRRAACGVRRAASQQLQRGRPLHLWRRDSTRAPED